MCGIVGISYDPGESQLAESVDRLELGFKKAISTLSHRGPDSNGDVYYRDAGVFLGHTRLAIQDLTDQGIQPMTSVDSSLTIVFNGEIYNFKTLRRRLEKLGYVFISNTDTEVILHLYSEIGADCFKELDGIFSIGLFDRRKQVLIVCRDGLGVKPLYFYNDDFSFIFGSEIKSIEQLIDKSKLSVSHENLNRYLSFQWCPGEGTPYSEIHKSAPGELIVISKGQVVERSRFYQLPIARPKRDLGGSSVDSVIVGLQNSLRNAVHSQMVSDAPVGAFLSGGLDSTSVVAFARELEANITCFTIDTGASNNDGMAEDLPYAHAAAKHLNVPLETIRVQPDALVRNLERMVWYLDEPLGDPAPLNVLYISQLARDSGIKVLLSGAGGDDIFTGYRRHRALQIDEKLQLLPAGLLSSVEAITGKLDMRVTAFRRIAKLFSGISLQGDSRIINYFRWSRQRDLLALYSEEFLQSLGEVEASRPIREFLETAHPDSTQLDRMLAVEQRFFTTDHNLLYTDKMSMAAGVEVRVPLLSADLIEYAHAIPDRMKQRGGHGKWIFKKAMEPFLPTNIIYRPKTGFGAPLRSWLRNELREYLEDLLSEKSLSSRGLFDPKAVRELIAKNNSGQADASYTIFSLMCIEIWCRQHIDGFGFDSSGSNSL